MTNLFDNIRDLLRHPTDGLSRKQYAVRYLLEIFRQGARRLYEDRAGNMAAALAFRTIFGLVPVLIIIILIFRAFGGAEVFGSFLEQLLVSANLDSVAAPDGESTLGTWLRHTISDVDEKISGRAVGLIGLLVLAWAAIGLISTIGAQPQHHLPGADQPRPHTPHPTLLDHPHCRSGPALSQLPLSRPLHQIHRRDQLDQSLRRCPVDRHRLPVGLAADAAHLSLPA